MEAGLLKITSMWIYSGQEVEFRPVGYFRDDDIS